MYEQKYQGVTPAWAIRETFTNSTSNNDFSVKLIASNDFWTISLRQIDVKKFTGGVLSILLDPDT